MKCLTWFSIGLIVGLCCNWQAQRASIVNGLIASGYVVYDPNGFFVEEFE